MSSQYKTLGVGGRGQFGPTVFVASAERLQGMEAVREYNRIAGDPTGRMMFLAVTLPIRRVEWRVDAGGDSPADQEAAEFVQSVMDDMSQTWADVIADVCRMFIFGYQLFWIVLKRRTEENSKYADGRVGVRKLEAVAQAAVTGWEYAEDGDVLGAHAINASQSSVLVPLEGSLYFRTSRAGDRPEGESIFEAARRPWRFRRRLEQIEGIGLHRRWAGFPVVGLPRGATTYATVGEAEVSDEQRGEELVEAVYEDRMMGAVLPFEWSIEFGGPEGNVDATMGETIKRKDAEMARAILAQFLLQGLMNVGTQSLAETLLDSFMSAVEAYLDSIRDEFNLYLVPLLMRHNDFPGLTGMPKLQHSSPRSVALGEVAAYVNVLMGHGLLSKDVSLEAFLRSQIPGMPTESLAADVVEGEEEDSAPAPAGGGSGAVQGVEEEEGGDAADFSRGFVRSPAGRRSFSRSETYRDLADGHGVAQREALVGWEGDLALELEELGPGASEAAVQSKLDDLVLVALLAFRERSILDIGAAFWLGFGAPAGPPEALEALQDEIETVDSWMGYGAGGRLSRLNPLGKPTLFGDIAGTLEGQISAILLLLKEGRMDEIGGVVSDAVSAATRGYSRVELYGGNVWHGVWAGVAAQHALDPDSGPVTWVMDVFAEHCHECPIFAGRYESLDALLDFTGGVLPGYGTECDGNCRCHLEDDTGVWL